MANEIAVGEQIRQFLRHVFGSRLTVHLEEELLRLREDYETRLRERETYIADLKADIQQLRSKVAEYELVLIPLTSGGLFGPKRPIPEFSEPITDTSWQAEQKRFYNQQEQEEAAEAAKEK